MKKEFSTTWLTCRPLEEKHMCAFRQLIDEPHVQKYFQIGDAADFLDGLKDYDCFPFGIFSIDSNKLLGYINGYVYNRSRGELLVEFFLTESYYYNFAYVTDLLRGFFSYCRKLGFTTFRFELEYDDSDINVLTNMLEVHGFPEEDYHKGDDGSEGKYVRVFKAIF